MKMANIVRHKTRKQVRIREVGSEGVIVIWKEVEGKVLTFEWKTFR